MNDEFKCILYFLVNTCKVGTSIPARLHCNFITLPKHAFIGKKEFISDTSAWPENLKERVYTLNQ